MEGWGGAIKNALSSWWDQGGEETGGRGEGGGAEGGVGGGGGGSSQGKGGMGEGVESKGVLQPGDGGLAPGGSEAMGQLSSLVATLKVQASLLKGVWVRIWVSVSARVRAEARARAKGTGLGLRPWRGLPRQSTLPSPVRRSRESTSAQTQSAPKPSGGAVGSDRGWGSSRICSAPYEPWGREKSPIILPQVCGN
ncbi:MAG: hypothetical protein SGPRY_007423 [Prymnesium sp.]